MELELWRYKDNGLGEYLGGIKKKHEGEYSILVQDRNNPFRDVLGELSSNKFSSEEEAKNFLINSLLIKYQLIKSSNWKRENYNYAL